MFLPGKSHGQRSLVGYGPWGRKELDMTEHVYTTFFTQMSAVKSFLNCKTSEIRKDDLMWSKTSHQKTHRENRWGNGRVFKLRMTNMLKRLRKNWQHAEHVGDFSREAETFFKAHEKARNEKYNIKVKSSFNLLNSRPSTRQKKGLMSIKSGQQKLFKLKHKAKNVLKGNRVSSICGSQIHPWIMFI